MDYMKLRKRSNPNIIEKKAEDREATGYGISKGYDSSTMSWPIERRVDASTAIPGRKR